MVHLHHQTVRVGEGGRIAHDERARGRIAQQGDRFLPANVRLVPVLGGVARKLHELGGHLLRFAVRVRGGRVAARRVAGEGFVLVDELLGPLLVATEQVLAAMVIGAKDIRDGDIRSQHYCKPLGVEFPMLRALDARNDTEQDHTHVVVVVAVPELILGVMFGLVVLLQRPVVVLAQKG